MTRRLGLAALIAVALAALSGCGSRTTVTTTRTVTVVRTVTATTGHARAVAPGFVPLSFTAVSDSAYWVLGAVPCGATQCTAILRTTDGGATFQRLASPELQGLGASGAQPTLRFADREDGWAFVTGAGGAVYATHDGGSNWSQVKLRSLIAFATGGSEAYAVTAACTPDNCDEFRFERSPVSGDAWSAEQMPFTPDGQVLDLSAHGADVWLLGTRASQAATRYDVLARSTDAGASFTVGDGPCVPGLGGHLAPSSASVLWAVCPTGMMADAARSTDGGATFTPLHTPGLANSADIVPSSDTSALLLRNGVGAPLLTTDAGATWHGVATPSGASFWPWAGFTDSRAGAAIVQFANGPQQLWRTTDGGASWHAVRFG